MPFPLIPTALGICFLLVWAFIGGMMFRDGQIAARREREIDTHILPLAFRPRGEATSNPRQSLSKPSRGRGEYRNVRAAS